MTNRVINYAAAVGVFGALCAASGVSFAQGVGVEIGPVGAYVDVGPDYGPYYGYSYWGPRYWYRHGSTHRIYGGPRSDLFNYEGPNRGAMERAH
jgi:hypothetical protein